MKNPYLRTVFLILGAGFFVIMILNANAVRTVQSQTTNTPNGGTQTSIVATCSVPSIHNSVIDAIGCGVNNALNTNNNQNTQTNDPTCPNGGIRINGTCPTSVNPLPSNTTVPNSVIPPPPPPTYETVQVIPVVSVTDSLGGTTSYTTSGTSFSLQSLLGQTKLSYIAQSGNNNPNIDRGSINLKIKLHTTANEQIKANGTMFVKLNNIDVHPAGIYFAISQVTDSNGDVYATMQIPTGINTQYMFTIADKQINTGSNPVNFTISNLKIQNGHNHSYVNTRVQNFYYTVLDSNPNQIIVKQADGTYIKAYPSDDTFTITSTATYVTGTDPVNHLVSYTWTAGKDAGSASVYKITSQGNVLLGQTGDIASVSGYCYHPDPNSIVCSPSNYGTKTQTISSIPRDTDIQIIVTQTGLPTQVKVYHTAITQQAYSFVCGTSCAFSP